MRILVISDTHGDLSNAEKLLSGDLGFDMIIHLGDYIRDAEKLEEEHPHLKVEYVYGNCDFTVRDVPADKLLEVHGRRIYITHGHRYSVKSGPDKLIQRARETGADILLYGHTHISSLIEGEGYTILNPGSISCSRDSFGESYAVIEIKGREMLYDICQI